jgi:hypothetical protein
MEIYKINNLCVNQTKTQFSLSYNKGIKLYNLKDLGLLSSSNSDDFILVKTNIYNFF